MPGRRETPSESFGLAPRNAGADLDEWRIAAHRRSLQVTGLRPDDEVVRATDEAVRASQKLLKDTLPEG